jgi:hypothetical protein
MQQPTASPGPDDIAAANAALRVVLPRARILLIGPANLLFQGVPALVSDIGFLTDKDTLASLTTALGQAEPRSYQGCQEYLLQVAAQTISLSPWEENLGRKAHWNGASIPRRMNGGWLEMVPLQRELEFYSRTNHQNGDLIARHLSGRETPRYVLWHMYRSWKAGAQRVITPDENGETLPPALHLLGHAAECLLKSALPPGTQGHDLMHLYMLAEQKGIRLPEQQLLALGHLADHHYPGEATNSIRYPSVGLHRYATLRYAEEPLEQLEEQIRPNIHAWTQEDIEAGAMAGN